MKSLIVKKKMLRFLIFYWAMSVSFVSSYYIRIESPTSQSHQQLLLTPQLDEAYQLHPQQIVPLYRFEYPNQQVLYYNPQTVQSTAGLHTLNYDHFNRLVNAQPVHAQEYNDESNEAVTIENSDFRSPIHFNNAYYAVNNEENPPIFYGDIDPQTGHPTSTIFSMQQLQPVERDEMHETSRDNERKETSTTMSSEVDSAETTTTSPESTTSPATTTIRIVVEDESMEEEEETSMKIAPQTTTESSVEDVEDLIAKEIALREQERKEETMSNVPPRQGSDDSIASAKPSALALAGVGGVASAKPRGTALTGDYGLSVASPQGTAVAGDYAELLSGNPDFIIKDMRKANRVVSTANIINEYRKSILL